LIDSNRPKLVVKRAKQSTVTFEENPHVATSSVAFGHQGAARESVLPKFVFAGATVAFLDGMFAVVVYVWILHRTNAGRIFQSIAAGLLGKASYDGGAATITLGVVCHVAIAFTWTAIYYFASRRLPSIRKLASSNGGNLVTGLVFGAVIWLGMDFVVIPLSAARFTSPANWQFWLQFGWHVVGLGPPLVRILR
jgi:hypothetical protein